MLVDFFKNLPWYILYPGKAMLAAVGGYVSQNPQIFPQWAVWLGAAVAAWIVLAFLWHALNAWREHKKRLRLQLEPTYLIILGLVIALGGAIWQMSKAPLMPVTTIAAQGAPNPTPTAMPNGSVLLASRYYSAKNKEEVADRIDKISDTINKPAEEMLLLAQQAMGGYLFSRPNEAQSYIQRMDEIKSAAKKMDAALYDDLLAKEREYRQEMNAILFPKDPFIKFSLAADEYRNGLSLWIKMRDSVQDDEGRRELQRLVTASQSSFSAARDGFLTWLSQRQEIISQTRRALRS
jgi:hypothetical protein